MATGEDLNRPQASLDFNPDSPIAGEKQDRLGRGAFAQSLAHALGAWKGETSLVMALYGEWGSGKSSIKNMMVEHTRAEDRLDVIEFNPWMISGEDRLVEEFFSSIGSYFNKKSSSSEPHKRVAKRWFTFGSVLAFGAKTVRALKPLAGLVPMGELFAKGAETVLEQSVELAQAGAATVEQFADAAVDLGTLKHDLKDALEELQKPILVVLDDIDRLTHDEIRLLFRLIKSNADLPNLRFILMFDRNVVEKALDVLASPGREYLEKIVQVGVDVPRASDSTVGKLLDEALAPLWAEYSRTEQIDSEYLGNLYRAGLSRHFRTLRDVARYINALQFSLRRFTVEGALEVNFSDLFALEALRVFQPNLYRSIPAFKEELTSTRERTYGHDLIKAHLKELFAGMDKADQEASRELLSRMFPQAGWMIHEGGAARYGSDWLDQWAKQRRVCHPDKFDRYFAYSTPIGEVSEHECRSVIVNAADSAGTEGRLRSFLKRGLIEPALDGALEHLDQLKPEAVASLVIACCNISDALPPSRPGFLVDRVEDKLSRLAIRALSSLQDSGANGVLTSIIDGSMGALLLVELDHYSLPPSKGKEGYRLFKLSRANIKSLRAAIVERVLRLADSGELVRHAHAGLLLRSWWQYGTRAEIRAWAKSQASPPRKLLSFVRAISSQGYTLGIGNYVGRSSLRVATWLPAQLFGKREYKRVMDKAAKSGELSKDEQEVIHAFKEQWPEFDAKAKRKNPAPAATQDQIESGEGSDGVQSE